MLKNPIQVIEDVDNRGRVIMVTQESQHHLGFYEVDREKDFAALFPLYGIELGNRGIRIRFHKSEEILVLSADAASLVHLDGNDPAARMETEAQTEAALSYMGYSQVYAICGVGSMTLIAPWQYASDDAVRVKLIAAAADQAQIPAEYVKIILPKNE